MLNDDDELHDLVDDNDQIIGTITHTAIYNGGLQGHNVRAASCFLMNSQHQLWIPRRLETKKIAPGGLDYSAGGHVTAGETYDQAMIREIEEEIGLQVTPDQLIPIGKETPADTPPHYYFSQIYLYLSDDAPKYNSEDFSGYEWLTVEELRGRLQSGDKAKASLLRSTDFILAYLKEHSPTPENKT